MSIKLNGARPRGYLRVSSRCPGCGNAGDVLKKGGFGHSSNFEANG